MRPSLAVCWLLWISNLTFAQATVEEHNDVRAEIQALKESLKEIRQELADSRREAGELRRDLQALREKMAMPPLESSR